MESTHYSETQEKADHLDCPRCGSKNTKFCYYNNYNKSQPRHFCKGCRRHWTKGGILRNVPLGNIRKNKRQKRRSNSEISTNSSCIVSQDEQGSAVKDQTKTASDALLDNVSGSSDDKSGVFSSATAEQTTQELSILEPNDQCSDAYHYILSQPWQNPTTSSGMDTSNLFWDWNEINSLISADLDIPLDETEITF